MGAGSRTGRHRICWGDTVSRSLGADRPSFAIRSRPLHSEGTGKTGCALHPRSRVQFAQRKCAHEHTGPAENTRPSLRNGFTAYVVVVLVRRALLPPSPAKGFPV